MKHLPATIVKYNGKKEELLTLRTMIKVIELNFEIHNVLIKALFKKYE